MGYPYWDLRQGTPPPRPGWVVPQVPTHHPAIQTWLEGRGYTWGTPHHPDLARGTPGTPTIQTWGGMPPPRPGMGYPPCRPEMGNHHTDLEWGTPHWNLGWRTPHPDLGWGTPDWDLGQGTPSQTWDGVPPSPLRCGLTNKLKTVPSPILRMQAVINLSLAKTWN